MEILHCRDNAVYLFVISTAGPPNHVQFGRPTAARRDKAPPFETGLIRQAGAETETRECQKPCHSRETCVFLFDGMLHVVNIPARSLASLRHYSIL